MRANKCELGDEAFVGFLWWLGGKVMRNCDCDVIFGKSFIAGWVGLFCLEFLRVIDKVAVVFMAINVELCDFWRGSNTKFHFSFIKTR